MSKKDNSFTIKSWADDDKPREKLINKGCFSLSDAELIAILIGSGNKNENAVALSKKILASVNNNLGRLGKLSVNQLMQFNGIGEAKAISIITALELGKRRRSENGTVKDKITCSKDLFELMLPVIGDLNHEEFWVVFLNNSNKVIYKMQLSKGGITGTLVDIRLVFKKAFEILATALVLCHNHPSGNLKPSTADINITQKIKKASESLDIKLLDHLIITEKAYFSFADNNKL